MLVREAPVVILEPIQTTEIQSSTIYLHLLSCECPFAASLESDTAQELSSSLNGAAREKLARRVWDVSDAYDASSPGNAVGIIE